MLGSGGKLETGHRGRGHGYIVGIIMFIELIAKTTDWLKWEREKKERETHINIYICVYI